MADSTITLRLNVGPGATIQSLGSVLSDFTSALTFASDLQRVSDRNRAVVARLRRRRDGGYYYFPGIVAFDGSFDAEAYIGFDRLSQIESDENAQIRVEQLSYENPVVLIITASGLVVLAVLRLIRDWPARQRLNNAAAAEYENTTMFRRRARDIILEKLSTDELQLTPQQIDSLLTADITEALGALGDSPLEISGLPDGSQDPSAEGNAQ